MARVRLWGLVSLFFLLAPSLSGVSSVAALPVPDATASTTSEAVGVIEHEGQPLLAELYLAIPAGADADLIARQSLEAVGARPMTPEDISVFGFTTFLPGGVIWGQFRDRQRQDDFVVQYYNPANDPTDGGGLPALLNTYETWEAVRTSSFRFEFGGVTDRTLGFLDGFNDMAWEEIGDPFTLGLTITAYSAEEIVEADVLMNTTALPFGWATDGSDYDVETVMLHENGHVLGLGHSDDPDAVMLPNYHGFARELGDDDIAGVSFLYPFGSAGRETDPPSRSGPFRVVAELGDPIPQGEIAFEFELGDLNDRGDVSFATDPPPSCFIECLEGEGLYITRMGELTEVARGGRPAPGGGQYGLGILGRLDLDSSGDAAFAFTLDPFELPFGSNAGVFYYKRASSQTEAIVTPHITQAPGTQGPFLGALDAALNDRGYVAFTGLTASGAGAYVYQPRAGIQTIAAPGTQAPGGETFDFAARPSINIRGDVAFEGHTSAEPCLTLDDPNILINCYSSVYVQSENTGEIVRIAGQGDPAPGGGTFRAAIGPVLNDRGYVVFAGDLTPAPALVESVGIFLATPDGDIIPVVRPGDEMPGGGRVVTTGIRSPEFSLNNLGEVAFSAVLDTHSGPPGFPNDMGLYVWRDGEIRLVARTGMRMPEIGAIAYLFAPGFIDFPRPQFSGGLINNRSEVLFQATLTNGDGLLLIATGAAVDPCYDGLDPNGDDALDSAFITDTEEYGQVLTGQLGGRLCSEMPTDRLLVDVPPDPLVVEGLFGATLRYDPAFGDAELQLLACDDSGCTQPLTPDASEAAPGLRSFIWHNTTGQTQRVAVEVRLTSGGAPALPYVLEVFIDLADIDPPPPPPPPPSCGEEFPSDDGAFFESPGSYGFVGVVCPDIPFNYFFTELPSGFRVDTVLTDPSSGGLGLSIYSCDALECAEVGERATGESADGGATQPASWTNCTGEPHFVIIEVSYLLAGEPVPFEFAVNADLDPVLCPA